MSLRSPWLTRAVILLVAGLSGIAAGRQWRTSRDLVLLDGQAPNEDRLVRTPTGGTPHYEPIQYRAKDARPAIMEPHFVSADEAHLVAGTMGIGVSINGESRFYPLFVLQYHQIVNDTCGGTPIACSY